MRSSASVHGEEAGEDSFPGKRLLGMMETIPDPAFLYLPGGRIAAVNHATSRLADIDPVGLTIRDLLDRYGARQPNGDPVNPGDLPYARALRGEMVTQGERIEMCLPDRSTYFALVTSRPIIVDGTVVAALSIWHDFAAYSRQLARSTRGEANASSR